MLKRCLIWLAPVLSLSLVVSACGRGTGTLTFNYSFDKSTEGWNGRFVDLPVSYNQAIYELEFAHENSPAGGGKALKIAGHNRSDDLFMFVRKQLTSADGLKPNIAYDVFIKVTLATSAPAGAVGIGGAPGESVVVKAGASAFEPKGIIENGAEPYFRLNLDKGIQNNSGRDAVIIGNIAKEKSADFDTWELKSLDNGANLLTVTTDKNGGLWVFVGTDSGFEGKTELYYTEIHVILTEK